MENTSSELIKGYIEKSRNKLRVAQRLLESGDYEDYEVFSYIDKETAETALNEAQKFVGETVSYFISLGLNL